MTIRFCEYCHRKEIGISRHRFSEWARAVENEQCIETRVCARCNLKESRPAPHKWETWHYEREDTCSQVRTCLDCSRTEYRIAEHNWTDWHVDPVTNIKERKCRRCARLEQTEATAAETAAAEAAMIAPTLETVQPLEEPAVESEPDIGVAPPLLIAVDDPPSDLSPAISHENGAEAEPAPEKPPKRKRKTKEAVAVVNVAEPGQSSQENGVEVKSLALLVIPQPSSEALPEAVKPATRKGKSKKKTGKLVDSDGCAEHQWGDWYYAEDSPCQLIRECSVCGRLDKETMAAQHELVWLQAQPPQPECLWLQQCQRCKHVETQENRHNLVWAAVPNEPCIREYKCEHCGHVDETQTNHTWFLTHRTDRGTEHYTCETCHKTMVR